jgi:hypothetical protein
VAKPMTIEAAGAEFFYSPWDGPHPRLQILMIEELLAGKRIHMPPPGQVNMTFKRAPKARSGPSTAQLPLQEAQ